MDDDMSGRRKKKATGNLELVDGDFEIQEGRSSEFDAEVDERNAGDDEEIHNKGKGTDDVDGDFEFPETGSNNDDEIISISVKITTSKTIFLDVKGSDTISDIKTKIEAKEHIPFYQQELIFHGMVLEDTCTLANLRVNKDSILTIMHKLTPEFISIRIINLQGELIFDSLKVNPSNTIRDLKAKLCCLEDVLAFNENVLYDSGTFADFQIFNGSTLTFIPKYTSCIQISVKSLTGTMIHLSVNLTDTMAKVKSKIEQRVQIPCDEQALIFNKTVLDDSYTLSDCNINMNSILKLMAKSKGFMKISIRTGAKEITLEVKPSDTINNVKAKILDKMHVPCDKHVLTFNEVLLDDMSTIADFHITSGSTLALTSMSGESMQIFIKNLIGEIIVLDVKHTDTIYDVKSKIYDKEMIPPPQQKLIYKSHNLEDCNTLAEYHICDGSTVYFLRLSGKMLD